MKILGISLKRDKTDKNKVTKDPFVAKAERDIMRKIAKADKALIDKIVKTFKDQSRKDIQKWRKALQMVNHPEKPRLNYLQDIYDDLSTDGHLKAQLRLRKYTTLNTPFTVTQVNDETNIEATKFFNSQWFYKFLEFALDAIFRGYTLVEFEEFFDNKVILNTLPRRNVVPGQKILIPDLSKKDTISYDDDSYKDWLIEIGETDDIGILNDIVPNLIWKRNVGQSWAEFTEKFGIPMITATTTSRDTKDIDKIEYMLSQLGEASTAVFPEGSTITFQEANRTDAYQSYEHFIHYNREEISVAIVGGTMITNDGSSRSQSEVHERNLDEKIAIADKRSIVFLVQDKLIPLLIRQGYKFLSETDTFSFATNHNLPLDKFWKIVKDITKDYEVDEEWISKTFYVPIKGQKKKIVPEESNAITALYSSDVNIPYYPENENNYTASSSSVKETLDKYRDQLAKEVWEKKDTLSTRTKIWITEANYLTKGLYEGWGKASVEIAWNEPDHLALSMMEYNLFEFSESKVEARLANMNQLILNKEKLKIREFPEFKKLATEVNSNINNSWLRTEYDLALSTGQNSAAYFRFMKEKQDVTAFVQYQTAGDDKVRDEHQMLDGKIFSLDDKTMFNLWPSNGYNCRCEMIQYLGNPVGKVMKGSEGISLMPENWHNSQFNINRGDLKQVFLTKQFYTKKVGLKAKLNDMNYKDTYGLMDWGQFRNKLKTIKIDNSINKDNVKELFHKNGTNKNGDFMGFEDYLKRKIMLDKESFEKHIKGHYIAPVEKRDKLFPFVKDTLIEPDEVWFYHYDNSYKIFNTRYIKFFKDEMFIVETRLDPEGLKVKTWYSLATKEGIKRKGLLINNSPLSVKDIE